MRTSAHPGDDVLVEALDGSLSSRRQSRLTAHLTVCPTCQARSQRLAAVIDEATTECRRSSSDEAVHQPDSRLRLERALLAAGEAWDRSWWNRMRTAFKQASDALPLAVGTALVAFAILLTTGSAGWLAAPSLATDGPLPVAGLTPGAVAPLGTAALCAGARAPRIVTEDVRRQVLAGYGMQLAATESYELDALITPELGGTTDAQNLWPQRYASPMWNAHVKDALERLLASRVCGGEMRLDDAQRDLAGNWVAAYKRHFGTEIPLSAHAWSEGDDEELQYESPSTVRVVRLLALARFAAP